MYHHHIVYLSWFFVYYFYVQCISCLPWCITYLLPLNFIPSDAQLGSQLGSFSPHQPAGMSLHSGWYSRLVWQEFTTIELIGCSDLVRILLIPNKVYAKPSYSCIRISWTPFSATYATVILSLYCELLWFRLKMSHAKVSVNKDKFNRFNISFLRAAFAITT